MQYLKRADRPRTKQAFAALPGSLAAENLPYCRMQIINLLRQIRCWQLIYPIDDGSALFEKMSAEKLDTLLSSDARSCIWRSKRFSTQDRSNLVNMVYAGASRPRHFAVLTKYMPIEAIDVVLIHIWHQYDQAMQEYWHTLLVALEQRRKEYPDSAVLHQTVDYVCQHLFDFNTLVLSRLGPHVLLQVQREAVKHLGTEATTKAMLQNTGTKAIDLIAKQYYFVEYSGWRTEKFGYYCLKPTVVTEALEMASQQWTSLGSSFIFGEAISYFSLFEKAFQAGSFDKSSYDVAKQFFEALFAIPGFELQSPGQLIVNNRSIIESALYYHDQYVRILLDVVPSNVLAPLLVLPCRSQEAEGNHENRHPLVLWLQKFHSTNDHYPFAKMMKIVANYLKEDKLREFVDKSEMLRAIYGLEDPSAREALEKIVEKVIEESTWSRGKTWLAWAHDILLSMSG